MKRIHQMSLDEKVQTLMKIDVYLAARFGTGSDKARTTMQELSELKKMLADEVVHFVFEKADGATRDACGTRAVDVIRRYENSAAHNPQMAFKGTFPYFDKEKGGGDASRWTSSSG